MPPGPFAAYSPVYGSKTPNAQKLPPNKFNTCNMRITVLIRQIAYHFANAQHKKD